MTAADCHRIRYLPEDEQASFREWLNGQTCPYIEDLPGDEQDAFYLHDYEDWKASLPPRD